jgi:predicted nucleic acid-binding protein
MYVHRVSNVRQLEIHTVELRSFEVEIAIAKMKKYKSTGTDHILAELIQAGGEKLCSRDPQTHQFCLE